MNAPDTNFDLLFNRICQVYEYIGIPKEVFNKWIMPLPDLKALVTVFLARKPHKILEIGTYVGITTQILAYYAMPDAVIDTIDPNLPLNIEIDAMRCSDRLENDVRPFDLAAKASTQLGLQHKIRYHAGGSTTAFNFATENNSDSERIPVVGLEVCEEHGPFDFIIIDGLHYDFAVETDLELAQKHLAPNGVIAIHDVIGRWGPHIRRAALKFLNKNPGFQFQHFPYADLYHAMGFFTQRRQGEPIALQGKTLHKPDLLDNEILLNSLCAWIVEKVRPGRIVMIGPDHHLLLPKLLARGVADVTCLRPGDDDRFMAPQPYDIAWNYDLPLPDVAGGDLCLCLSVCDRLSEAEQTHLVKACATLAPLVVFSSTEPGELEANVFTPQPFRLWFDRFWQAGYLPSDDIRQHFEPWLSASKQASTHLLSSFCLNILLFRKIFDIQGELADREVFRDALGDAFTRINELSVQLMESNLRLHDSFQLQEASQKQYEILEASLGTTGNTVKKRSRTRVFLSNIVACVTESFTLMRKGELRLLWQKVRQNIRNLISAILGQRILDLPYIEPDYDLSVSMAFPQRPIQSGRAASHCFFIGSLSSGGAERQVTALARELKTRGLDIRVFCMFLESAEQRHYLPHLQEAGVPVLVPRQRALIWALFHLWRNKRDISVFQYVPPTIRLDVLRLYGELLLAPADILHCWLDHTNCIGGWAGLLAGVPLTRLSFRNMNPTRFPYLYAPWMHATYSFLSMYPNVTFEANSTLGGHDYADWLGISRDRVRIIPNGVCQAAFSKPNQGEVSDLRRSLGLALDAPLICCVFRLSPEKRPLDLIPIMLRLRQLVPGAHLIHAGMGAMEGELREAIRQNNLDDCVHLLGRRRDIPHLLCAADVVLLTSEYEGMPNILLESLLVECPVVATYTGGAPEVIVSGEHGFLHRPGDIAGLTESLHTLLVDRQLNQRFGQAGRRRVLSDFTSQRLADSVLTSYTRSLETLHA